MASLEQLASNNQRSSVYCAQITVHLEAQRRDLNFQGVVLKLPQERDDRGIEAQE